jgi:hypothetical protein
VAKIDRGRIVWLTNVIDSQGNPTADHRAVILTTKADYEAGKPIQAAYISSKLDYTSKDRMVTLKHARGGHPQTGLDRPSAVICDWLNREVDEEDITSYGNMIYGATLIEGMEKVEKAMQA